MTTEIKTALEEIASLAREHGYAKRGPLSSDSVGFGPTGRAQHIDEYDSRDGYLAVTSEHGTLIGWSIRLPRGVASGTTAHKLRTLLAT